MGEKQNNFMQERVNEKKKKNSCKKEVKKKNSCRVNRTVGFTNCTLSNLTN